MAVPLGLGHSLLEPGCCSWQPAGAQSSHARRFTALSKDLGIRLLAYHCIIRGRRRANTAKSIVTVMVAPAWFAGDFPMYFSFGSPAQQ